MFSKSWACRFDNVVVHPRIWLPQAGLREARQHQRAVPSGLQDIAVTVTAEVTIANQDIGFV